MGQTIQALILASLVLYALAAVRAFFLMRVLGSVLPALVLAAALVLMGAERLGHLLPGHPAGDSGWGATVELSAAVFVFLVLAFLPRIIRALVGSGAPEERVRALLESADDVVLVLDADAQSILAVNARGADLLGRRADELAGVAPLEIAPELGPARLAELVAPLVSGRAPWVRSETDFRRRDGSTWPVGIHLQWGRWLGAEVLVLVGVDLTSRKAAEEELRKSRRRLEDAQRVAGLATWEWDLARDRLTWSDELYRIFGREPGSFEPRFDKVLEAIHPEDRERMRALVLEAVTSRAGFETRYRLVRAGNETRWVHVAARWEASEEVEGRLVGVSQDITRLREAEAAVKSSERRYRRLFEEAPVSLWEEDLSAVLQRLESLKQEGVTDLGAHLREHPEVLQELAGLVRVLDVNPATLELYGIPSKDEMLSRFKLTVDEYSAHALLRTLEALFEGQSHVQVTTKERGSDGKVRDLLVAMNLPQSPEHQGVALVSVVDLSERLAAAEALREREAELSRALSAARMGIWEWDVTTGRVTWSKEVYAIFGATAAGFDGTVESYMGLIHPDDIPIIQGDIERAIRSGGDYHTEVRLRPDPDGRILWMAGAGKVEFDAEGRPRTLRGLVWDVTAQRAAEQALRETEARLSWLVRHAPLILFALDAEGRFTFSAGKALSALGLQPGQVIGQSALEIYRDVPGIVADVRRALAGEVAVSTVALGHVVFEARYHPTRDEAGAVNGVIGVATDITDVVRAEAEQVKLARLVEGTRDLVGLATPEGRIAYLNPAGAALLGLPSLEAARGRSVAEFLTDPDRFEQDVMPQVRAQGNWQGEVSVRRVDTGEAIPCSGSVFMIGEPASGEPTAWATVLRDLRKEREAALERERMERQLRQAQKMETIGTLAGGIAHDFNNLLTPILGYAQMMEGELPEGHPVRGDLQEVVHAASRAKDLVQQILSFARQTEQDLRPVDLSPVVREATRLLRATLPSAIDVRVHVEEGCGWVKADPTQIHQVVMNLATNALHAMRDRNGVLGIDLAEVQVDDVFVLDHPELAPGPHLRLAVSDTGHGMSREVLERAMEPFFTTKEAGEGTGLGLSVVHGIVASHQGALSIHSEEGAGTTVNVYLPVADRAAGVPAGGVEEVGPQRRLRVLVVDDRADIVSLVKRMVEALGHEAEAAVGSPEALARFQARPGYFDAMITDYSMPEMSGLELVRRIRALRPDLPAVLVSGFSEALTPERLEAEGIGAFLMKPFVARELVRALERAVERARSPRPGG